MFRSSSENGVRMEPEELNGMEDIDDDTALRPEELVSMMDGVDSQLNEHGAFIARSALDEEMTDKDGKGEVDEYATAGK